MKVRVGTTYRDDASKKAQGPQISEVNTITFTLPGTDEKISDNLYAPSLQPMMKNESPHDL